MQRSRLLLSHLYLLSGRGTRLRYLHYRKVHWYHQESVRRVSIVCCQPLRVDNTGIVTRTMASASVHQDEVASIVSSPNVTHWRMGTKDVYVKKANHANVKRARVELTAVCARLTRSA